MLRKLIENFGEVKVEEVQRSKRRGSLEKPDIILTCRQLDLVFYNVREIPILEEAICDASDPGWMWKGFDQHIRMLNNSSHIQVNIRQKLK